MGVVHRTIFTWFTVLVFLILLVLRVDGRTQWNWFVVFIPAWVFNAILLIYAIFRTTSNCKNRIDSISQVLRNAAIIGGLLLMLTFEILLCMKLEYPALNISLPNVMIPLWTILSLLVVRVFKALIDAAMAHGL